VSDEKERSLSGWKLCPSRPGNVRVTVLGLDY